MNDKSDGPSKMLRLDSALWGRVAAAAERVGRTTRQEVETRLRDSLRGMPSNTPSPATALSRLIQLHAEDVAAYCQSAEEWQSEIKLGIPALVNELFGQVKDSGAQGASLAVLQARALAQKVRRAHLPTLRTGDPLAVRWAEEAERALSQEQPSLARLQHEELLRLRRALFLSEGVETPSHIANGEKVGSEGDGEEG
jgi:hypothetical protein